MIPHFDIIPSKCVCESVGINLPWYKDIYSYLHDQYISPDFSQNKCKILIRQVTHYVNIIETLHQKGLN